MFVTWAINKLGTVDSHVEVGDIHIEISLAEIRVRKVKNAGRRI